MAIFSFTTVFLLSIFYSSNSLPVAKPFLEATNENSLPEAKFFDQDLDHTGEQGGTFKQLYYESLSDAGGNDDLKFLFIGGESALSTGSVSMNFMSQLADKFLADKYALEHRYYGKSQPMKNLTTESLKYLTIENALEDIKNFISFINSNTPGAVNKWILFGGSYAGNLAAWARIQYPDVVLGAIASSAPVEAQLNFKEYLERVTQIMESKDAECVLDIKEAMNKLVQSFNNEEGRQKLKTLFRMCELPKDQYDKFSLTSFVADLFFDAVEYNIKAGDTDRMSSLCNDLRSRKGDKLEMLGSLVSSHYAVEDGCFNYNYDSNKNLFATDINEYNYGRQRYYQKCTELGFFQTTGSNSQPFAHSLPLLYYTKLCSDAFGKNFNEKTITAGIEQTNAKYKGKNLNDASNVVMVYGSADPWSMLGVQSFSTNSSKVILIEDGWHCQDMMRMSENDPIDIRKSRGEISNAVENWASD